MPPFTSRGEFGNALIVPTPLRTSQHSASERIDGILGGLCVSTPLLLSRIEFRLSVRHRVGFVCAGNTEINRSPSTFQGGTPGSTNLAVL
jgi:hypothetical protein